MDTRALANFAREDIFFVVQSIKFLSFPLFIAGKRLVHKRGNLMYYELLTIYYRFLLHNENKTLISVCLHSASSTFPTLDDVRSTKEKG
mgnify:CR=1 FL=1